jgi:hypothetical protein
LEREDEDGTDTKGIYTPEFWVEAVKLVEKEGLSVDAAAKLLVSTEEQPWQLGTCFAQGKTGNSSRADGDRS